LFIADKDGNNVQLLVEIPGAVSHGSPHWSSDGKLILFDATPGERQYQLGRIYACAVGGPFNGNVAEMSYGACARFPHDMKHIAFHVRGGNPDKLEAGIYVMRDDGTQRRRLCDGIRPRWTTDDKSLVFVSQQADGPSAEIIGIDGTSRHPLVKTRYASVAGIDPAPGGKEICYIAYPDRLYEGVLCRASLGIEPTEPMEIYRGRLGYGPSWSPDGKQIAFWLMDDKANRHLAVIDADAKAPPKELVNQERTRFNADPVWSPDGERIAFSSDRDPNAK
jgi:Tol biopolymer transport system component